MKKVYNKLVRDRIPSIIEKDGHKFKTHTATPEEYREKLKEKLQEEVNELLENPCAEEMADILEVMEAMRKEFNIDLDVVRFQKESKLVNRGGFTSRTILDWTKEPNLLKQLEKSSKRDKDSVVIRNGSHVTLDMGNTETLTKDFKTSGQK